MLNCQKTEIKSLHFLMHNIVRLGIPTLYFKIAAEMLVETRGNTKTFYFLSVCLLCDTCWKVFCLTSYIVDMLLRYHI